MPINIHILSSSPDIRPYEKKLRSTTEAVVEATKNMLPIADIDVVFYDNPEGVIPEVGGLGGYTPSKNTVFISLDPRNEAFSKALDTELFYQLAHEFHHAVRFRTPIEKDTLFEAMISEGLADHFAMEVSGRTKPQPWSCTLSTEQKISFMEKARKEWNAAPYDHSAWFYGSVPAAIPRWAGYTLGYELVGQYLLAHKGTSAATLASADANIFL